MAKHGKKKPVTQRAKNSSAQKTHLTKIKNAVTKPWAREQQKVENKKVVRSMNAADGPTSTNGSDRDITNVQGNIVSPDVDSEEFFRWMIGSKVTPIEFFEDFWEKKPLLVKRSKHDYYDGYFTKADLDFLIRTNVIRFGINLDITSCVDGVRTTQTPDGRAYPGCVWDFYESGSSVRLLNPQSFREPVWRMLSTLQNFFLCGMGANVYFTPKQTQGFAPHYDDIEAFVLQTEGSKRWRVYAPESNDEVLPRNSSTNYTVESMANRTPVIDTVLHAGEMLYFPRGWVHQANATNEDSTHITVSTYQNNSWATFMEKAVPNVLASTLAHDTSFRVGLPMGYLNYMGVGMSDCSEPNKLAGRKEFEETFRALWARLGESVVESLDSVSDQMAVHVMGEALPPVLTREEIHRTAAAGVLADPAYPNPLSEPSDHEINEDTFVSVVRKHVARIVHEDDFVIVYHSLENGRCREFPPQELRFHASHGPLVEYFLQTNDNNNWVKVGNAIGIDIGAIVDDDLNDNDDGETCPASVEDVFQVVIALYDAGLLMRQLDR
eukprot:CFRG2505T1